MGRQYIKFIILKEAVVYLVCQLTGLPYEEADTRCSATNYLHLVLRTEVQCNSECVLGIWVEYYIHLHLSIGLFLFNRWCLVTVIRCKYKFNKALKHVIKICVHTPLHLWDFIVGKSIYIWKFPTHFVYVYLIIMFLHVRACVPYYLCR